MSRLYKNVVSCIRLGVTVICIYCSADNVIRSGKNQKEEQRYLCKKCKRRFINNYQYKAYKTDINQQIVQFTKEGVGIRSTARILAISTTTLLKRILSIASSISSPSITKGGSYEVDEMRTFVKKKSRLIWIVYALERSTKSVVSFNVGARTNRTLKVVLKTLQYSEAKRIYTDRLASYKYLISKPIHRTTHNIDIGMMRFSYIASVKSKDSVFAKLDNIAKSENWSLVSSSVISREYSKKLNQYPSDIGQTIVKLELDTTENRIRFNIK